MVFIQDIGQHACRLYSTILLGILYPTLSRCVRVYVYVYVYVYIAGLVKVCFLPLSK